MSQIEKQPFIVRRPYLDPISGWFFPKGCWATILAIHDDLVNTECEADIMGKKVWIPLWNLAPVQKPNYDGFYRHQQENKYFQEWLMCGGNTDGLN